MNLTRFIKNDEEISDFYSFDEQVHAMNENTGGNVGDMDHF